MKFVTAINCMDGRVQEPVVAYMKKEFQAEYVDMITEPGPNQFLAGDVSQSKVDAIIERTLISVEKHGSQVIAITGHHDCAGNPIGRTEQDLQTKMAVTFLKNKFPNVTVIGLWIDENWDVHRLD